MAKITINPLASVYGLDTAINLRFQQIEDTLNDNVLWRDGFVGESNEMSVDLDMNGQSILNVTEITSGGVGVIELIEANTALIEANTLDIAALDARVTTNEGNISSNASNITSLDARITVNETDISGKEDYLGTPAADDYVLTSTAAGVRSWVENVGGGGDIGDLIVTSTVNDDDISSSKEAFTMSMGAVDAVSMTSTPAAPATLAPVLNDSYNATAQVTNTHAVQFKPDGTKMYLLSFSTQTVEQYSLSTAWDVTTATYDSKSLAVGGQELSPQALFISTDGTRLYIAGADNHISQWNMTAWDVGSALYVNDGTHAGSGTSVGGMFFSSDGSAVWEVYVSGYVYRHSLSSPWLISSIQLDGTWVDLRSESTDFSGITFSADGTKMFLSDNTENSVFQYALSPAWDETSATYEGLFSMGAQDGFPADITFGDSGNKLYMAGSNSDSVYEYDCSPAYNVIVTAGSSAETATSLLHDGVTRLATTADGVTVTGALTTTGGVDSLKSATTVVDVAGATAPSAGQALVATGPSAATWQDMASDNWMDANGGSDFAVAPVANGDRAIAIGHEATAPKTFDVSIGYLNKDGSSGTGRNTLIGIDNSSVSNNGSNNTLIGISNEVNPLTYRNSSYGIGIGFNNRVLDDYEVCIGSSISESSTTEHGAFHARIGYGWAGADLGLMHLYPKGKFGLHGTDSQYLMPQYTTVNLPTPVAGEVSIAYDSTVGSVVWSNGTAWAGLGGSSNTWLIANNGSDFFTDPTAAGESAIAIGEAAKATKARTIAIGRNAQDNSSGSGENILIGYDAITTNNNGSNNIAIGRNCTINPTVYTNSQYSIAMGYYCNVIDDREICIGSSVNNSSPVAGGANTVRIGTGLNTVDASLIYMRPKGKFGLYGDEAQFIIPSYATASIPATTLTGGLVYDTDTDELKIYDAGWNAVGGIANVVEDTTPELGGDLNGGSFDINTVKNVTFVSEVANTGTTQTIDWTAGQKQNTTITAATGVTFTAPAGPCNLTLKVINGGTGTITWPATVKWPGGVEPGWTTTGTDICSFYYDGTNYYGMAGLAFA